jgi:hypothetical protein
MASTRFCSEAFINGWVLSNKRKKTISQPMTALIKEIMDWANLDMGNFSSSLLIHSFIFITTGDHRDAYAALSNSAMLSLFILISPQ